MVQLEYSICRILSKIIYLTVSSKSSQTIKWKTEEFHNKWNETPKPTDQFYHQKKSYKSTLCSL